jgi:hypothetical protein
MRQTIFLAYAKGSERIAMIGLCKIGDGIGHEYSMLQPKSDERTRISPVLNEPDARVFIGDTPPNFKPDHKVIAKVSIPSVIGSRSSSPFRPT